MAHLIARLIRSLKGEKSRKRVLFRTGFICGRPELDILTIYYLSVREGQIGPGCRRYIVVTEAKSRVQPETFHRLLTSSKGNVDNSYRLHQPSVPHIPQSLQFASRTSSHPTD